MRIAIINGPNINLLGLREPAIYGSGTLDELEILLQKKAKELGMIPVFFQSNHEGQLVDFIQSLWGKCDGIIINPAAYTHTSIAILDALQAVGIPTVEVHLSDPSKREPFRHHSYVSLVAEKTIAGQGFRGYVEALEYFRKRN